MKRKIRVLTVFGTRPEAIKMCPLVNELKRHEEIESIVCVTGQHREMLDQVLRLFGIIPDYDLKIMKEEQTLTTITADVIVRMDHILCEVNPDLVLIHGDTTTSFAAGLSAFYHKIAVGHVEAGLRSYQMYSPFPEEMNRCMNSKISTLHFAPTQSNVENLKQEGITEGVFLTGNTGLDSFKTTIQEEYKYKNAELQKIIQQNKRIILMTAHRRENLGSPLENICRAVKRIADEHEELIIVYCVHPNPKVRKIVGREMQGIERIALLEPLNVMDMHNIMKQSYLIVTDSGGLQEEAPSLGIPVIVVREETERPEAVEAGTVIVAGTNEDIVYQTIESLLTDHEKYEKMAHAVNPYGDGNSSQRIVRHIINWGQQNIG